MNEKSIRVINIVLYIIAIILFLTMLGLVFNAVSEYNSGKGGYSYSTSSPEDLASDLEYGSYEWVLRDLKNYRNILWTDEAYKYDEIRGVAEYYQYSVLAKSYFYTKDKEKAGLYAQKAAEAAGEMGQYAAYQKDIDNAISTIGD